MSDSSAPARSQTESSAERELRRAAAFAEGLIDPVLIMDLELRPLSFNAVYQQYTGWRPRQLLHALARGTPPFELLGRSTPRDLDRARQALATRRAVRIAEVEMYNAVGAKFVMWQSFTPVIDDFGEVVGVMVILRDVSAEARMQERYRALLARERARADELVMTVAERTAQLAEMARLSARDPLTGLLNRRAFAERSREALERERLAGRSSALMLCDLDYFKAVNDRHGHAAGDVALTAVADCLRSATNATDVVGRHGGDELVVLVAGVSIEQAVGVAQRCAQRVRNLCLRKHQEKLTLSIGIAADPARGATIAELIHHADEALRDAKRRGRNRISVFRPAASFDPAPTPSEVRQVVLLVDPDDGWASEWSEALRERCDPEWHATGESVVERCVQGPVHFVVARERDGGASGLELLEQSVAVAPDACRVLVLDSDDLGLAIAAANSDYVDVLLRGELGKEGLAAAINRARAKVSARGRSQMPKLLGKSTEQLWAVQ